MTLQEEREAIARQIHVGWLSKAKTAVIDGSEMTVLPYGYLSQAVKDALLSYEEKVVARVREEEQTKINDFLLALTLCDHIGDVWDDVNSIFLEDDEELKNADKEYHGEDDDEEAKSDFTKILRKRGAKYNFEKTPVLTVPITDEV